jgi:Mlc titration factor MtfA (ptsG expression regulator)
MKIIGILAQALERIPLGVDAREQHLDRAQLAGLEHLQCVRDQDAAVVVYLQEFVPQRDWIGDDGVVWTAREPLSGEAWEQGPVILSWADIHAGLGRDGDNVIIHGLAHKLDMRDGTANGCPPLPRSMPHKSWVDAFGEASDNLCNRADAGARTRPSIRMRRPRPRSSSPSAARPSSRCRTCSQRNIRASTPS